jgi:hypothetical protein
MTASPFEKYRTAAMPHRKMGRGPRMRIEPHHVSDTKSLHGSRIVKKYVLFQTFALKIDFANAYFPAPVSINAYNELSLSLYRGCKSPRRPPGWRRKGSMFECLEAPVVACCIPHPHTSASLARRASKSFEHRAPIIFIIERTPSVSESVWSNAFSKLWMSPTRSQL